MSDSIRLFLGVPLSIASVRAVEDVSRSLRDAALDAGTKIKWVSPATYHITLQFLGWTRPEVVEAVRDEVGKVLAGQRGFWLELRGVGAFPKSERGRVIWIGLDDADQKLASIAAAVQEATSELGFQKEKRAFHAHVTLGRLKQPSDVRGLLEPYAEHRFSETFVNSVVLYESVLKSTGSEYTRRVEWPLEAGSNGRKRQTERLKRGLQDEEQRSGEDTHGSEQKSE